MSYQEGPSEEPDHICRPESHDVIKGGLYSELIIEPHVRNVKLDGPAFMIRVTIQGKGVVGTLYASKHAEVDLGDNTVYCVREKPRELARRADLI